MWNFTCKEILPILRIQCHFYVVNDWIPNRDINRKRKETLLCFVQHKRFLPFFLNKQTDFGIHKPRAGLHCKLHGMPQGRLTVQQSNSEADSHLFEIKYILHFVKIKAFDLVYVQSKTTIWILPVSKNLFNPPPIWRKEVSPFR